MTSTTAVVTPTTLAKEQVLKEGYIVDEKDRPKVGYKDFSDDIPVISLAGVLEDGRRREEIVKEIAAASEEWGIFQVVDHGVDTQLISQMTELAKEFFALPDEEKLRFQAAPGKKGGFIISSHLQNQVVANWREFVLFFTYPIHDRDYSRWPEKPEEWRAATEVYSQRLMNLSLLMLELVSEGLGLEKDALKNSMGEIGQHLVVNHYPKCPKPDLALGLTRHTDPGSITVLFQDDVGGLQATKDDGNTWVTVRPIKNSLVVNLGDHVYHMSNGRFKSADHKAVVNANETRMSIAVFTNPQEQATVYPLGIGPGDKSMLEKPITYAELRRRHDIMYIEVPRLKKLAKEENWSQEELELKLSQLK